MKEKGKEEGMNGMEEKVKEVRQQDAEGRRYRLKEKVIEEKENKWKTKEERK